MRTVAQGLGDTVFATDSEKAMAAACPESPNFKPEC